MRKMEGGMEKGSRGRRTGEGIKEGIGRGGEGKWT
jgi:hypothetical protein